ncbi:MAG: DUF120 domain-containing protein [Euryarchaeota archaeon]|nr:DUF120 domain-containing protein [Euryarchaeota archaeon]
MATTQEMPSETLRASRPSDPVSPLEKEALKQIALLGGIMEQVELNSSEFASLLATSQQTASRRILELVEEGLVERDLGVRKQRLKITPQGLEVLKAEHAAYQRIFELSETVHLTGRVRSGVGEGQYYMSQDGYVRQFRAKMGFTPYPGTLNVELSGPEVNKLRLLKARPAVVIERFQTEERTFGGVHAWPARISGRACAAILPNRTHYTRVIEVIAPEHLRSSLSLKDDDPVELEVEVRD